MQALNTRLDRVLLLGRCSGPDPIDQPTDAQRMMNFLAEFKTSSPLYPHLCTGTRARIDAALALDPVPEYLARSFAVFEQHCAGSMHDPMSVQALTFFMMLPG